MHDPPSLLPKSLPCFAEFVLHRKTTEHSNLAEQWRRRPANRLVILPGGDTEVLKSLYFNLILYSFCNDGFQLRAAFRSSGNKIKDLRIERFCFPMVLLNFFFFVDAFAGNTASLANNGEPFSEPNRRKLLLQSLRGKMWNMNIFF